MSLFIQGAAREGRNDRGFYLLGILLSFVVGQLLGAIPLVTLLYSKHSLSAETLTNPTQAGIDTNLFMTLMLFPFLLSFLILWGMIRYVHRKRFITAWTAYGSIQWKRIIFSFLLWFGLSLLMDGLGYLLNPENYEFHYSGVHFWVLVGISLVLLPIQTTYEELLFRSYILQAVGIWKPMRLIPFLISGITFGLMHMMNPEVKEYGYITLVSYIGIGLLLSLITILSDSIELAVGLHAANNIYGATVMSFKGSALSTDTLFYTKEYSVDISSNIIYLGVLVVYFIIVRKKFQLLPLKSLLER